MTRQQKGILLVLGILNIIIFILVGSIVLPDILAPSPPIVITVTACEQNLLAAFPLAQHPASTWTAQQLTLRLSTPGPPEPESAQQLWMALDTLATIFQEGCPIPETVVIAITVGIEAPHQHQAQFSGGDIAAWIDGTLSEADLAARSRYRSMLPGASTPAQP